MRQARAGAARAPRLADALSVGVLARTFPLARVHAVLAETARASQRERDLPAHVMVYYVIALALYLPLPYREVLRCVLDGVRGGQPDGLGRVAGKAAVSQARTRLGVAPLAQLYRTAVGPIATPETPGAWYRQGAHAWRVVSLDGATLDVADTPANAAAFGRPGSPGGVSGFPQVRLVTLVETGTHVLFGAELGPYTTDERVLADALLPRLTPEMLCLADRNFYGYARWQAAAATGAALLWRVKATLGLPCDARLPDGSYRSHVYPGSRARARGQGAVPVRVIEYTLPGVPTAAPRYRLLTTLLDPALAPAAELAALYHERWEVETAFDELKTHVRGGRLVLRSRTPALVAQETYGLLLAHYAVRGLMHEAAQAVGRDPDTLSFVHAVRTVRRALPRVAAFPPSGLATAP